MRDIQFIDLQAQRAHLGTRIDDAITRVLDHGRFIMGPEIATFEAQLCEFGEAAHAVRIMKMCFGVSRRMTFP